MFLSFRSLFQQLLVSREILAVSFGKGGTLESLFPKKILQLSKSTKMYAVLFQQLYDQLFGDILSLHDLHLDFDDSASNLVRQ